MSAQSIALPKPHSLRGTAETYCVLTQNDTVQNEYVYDLGRRSVAYSPRMTLLQNGEELQFYKVTVAYSPRMTLLQNHYGASLLPL